MFCLPPGGLRFLPLSKFPKRHAVIFGSAFATVKTGVADIIAQKYIERKEKINYRRALSFSLFGLGYLGFIQYWWYNVVYARLLFARGCQMLNLPLKQRLSSGYFLGVGLAQTAFDYVFLAPNFYYPSFYLVKEYLMTDGAEGWASNAMCRWRENKYEDMLAYLKVWCPVMVVTFTCFPSYLRVTCIAVVSFGWTIYLSLTRGDETECECEEE